ncbi:MAG: HAMP domain-containing protein [Magnetococcales bacterium]|nr:HAMP domain-containing protein [Magnetococcales bacterium]MBF0151559.1 HAMP domain-containing protein [Magnetococcales bacterium]
MNPRFSINLAGRIVFILLIGLTFSHILSILVFTSEKLEPAVLGSESEVVERMAVVVRTLVSIPHELHEPIVSALERNGLHVNILAPSAPRWEPEGASEDPSLHRHLEKKIELTGARVVAFHANDSDWNHRHGWLHRVLFSLEMSIIRLMHEMVKERELRAWIDLPNGERILLESLLTDNHVPLFRHATLSVIIMTGAIIVFSLVIARAMTRPLRRIVEAADTVGQDLQAAPLPETGPAEVVAVARAFNRMNHRIRTFVEDRLGMIAAISHDLRTPLTKLKLLAEYVGDETTRKRMVGTLDEMESMLAATLSFARDTVVTEPRQRVNLTSLVGAICTDLVDAGQQVVFVEGDRLIGHCRPLALKRAVTNLIDNAVQYGGAAQVTLFCEQQQRFVILIHDPGPGIPVAQWDNVFKPFLRLEPARESGMGNVGLGLAIAAAIIRDHNGTIRFGHPEEGGFITRVELPVAD